MKRYVADREGLKNMYSPMDERFERNMRAMIDTLPARREHKRARMKPRYAVAFALLMVLLLCATALAAYVVNRGFFSDVAQMESEHGYYEHWTIEDKEKLVTSMKEYGVLADEAQWNTALAIENEAKREKRLDELFAQRYGVRGRTDTITAAGIIEQELGLYDSAWSLEQKADYSAILMEFDLMGSDTNVDLLPGEDDISQEEAVHIAQEAVLDAYGLEDGALDAYEINIYFWEHRTEIGVKPPYYLIEMICAGQVPYFVYISGDGRVLSREDGYKGVESPWEDARRIERVRKTGEMGAEKIVQKHIRSLRTLPTQIYQRDGVIKQLINLRDGTALMTGMIYDKNNKAVEVFAESLNAEAQTLWRAVHPVGPGEDVSLRTAMQLENGDILLLVERKKWIDNSTLDYQYSEQITICETGEIKEVIRLDSIAQMIGQAKDFDEQMFGAPGHGGLLVSGSMGTKHTKAYAQLDASGHVRFIFEFGELRGYAPYLKTTEDGYMLTAWNDAADMPILRFYDQQGRLIREGEFDERLKGLRINRVSKAEEGRYAVTSNFMDDGRWELAFIDGDGRLLSRHEKEFDSGAIQNPSEIIKIGEKYAYACAHWCDPDVSDTGHLGLLICDEKGSLEEYHMQNAGESLGDLIDGDMVGWPQMVSIAENTLMIAGTRAIDEREHYKTTIAVVALEE